MKISRTITYTVTIEAISKNFLMFNETYQRIRNGAVYKGFECFLCNKPFEDNDKISLVFIKNQANKVVCEKCGIEIEKELEEIKNE